MQERYGEGGGVFSKGMFLWRGKTKKNANWIKDSEDHLFNTARYYDYAEASVGDYDKNPCYLGGGRKGEG